MQTLSFTSPHSVTTELGLRTTKSARSIWQRLRTTFLVMSERRALAGLSDEALKDIGVDRGQANREASRPVWDMPANR